MILSLDLQALPLFLQPMVGLASLPGCPTGPRSDLLPPREAQPSFLLGFFLLESFMTPHPHFALLHRIILFSLTVSLCSLPVPCQTPRGLFSPFPRIPSIHFFSLCISLGNVDPSEGQSPYETLGPEAMEGKLFLEEPLSAACPAQRDSLGNGDGKSVSTEHAQDTPPSHETAYT